MTPMWHRQESNPPNALILPCSLADFCTLKWLEVVLGYSLHVEEVNQLTLGYPHQSIALTRTHETHCVFLHQQVMPICKLRFLPLPKYGMAQKTLEKVSEKNALLLTVGDTTATLNIPSPPEEISGLDAPCHTLASSYFVLVGVVAEPHVVRHHVAAECLPLLLLLQFQGHSIRVWEEVAHKQSQMDSFLWRSACLCYNNIQPKTAM